MIHRKNTKYGCSCPFPVSLKIFIEKCSFPVSLKNGHFRFCEIMGKSVLIKIVISGFITMFISG